MNAPAEKRRAGLLTEEQYEIFLRTRPEEERWQLIDGVAVMMPPPTLRHQFIGGNLYSLLRGALERNRPELAVLYESGLRIEGVPAFLPVPDLLVIDQPVGEGSYADRFYLTAEILSDSNTQEYMSLKIERYAQHPANLYSLIIGQKDFYLELWSRAEAWKGRVMRSGEDTLELPELGFRCALRDLYRGTPLG
jgi:Uma2 family endonuclease